MFDPVAEEGNEPKRTIVFEDPTFLQPSSRRYSVRHRKALLEYDHYLAKFVGIVDLLRSLWAITCGSSLHAKVFMDTYVCLRCSAKIIAARSNGYWNGSRRGTSY